MEPNTQIETTVSWLLLSLLAAGCYVVLQPFLSALAWALVLSMSTWPAYRWCELRLRGRRTLAAGVMVVGLLALLIVPLVLAITTLADNIGMIMEHLQRVAQQKPLPPDWLSKIPIVGTQAVTFWHQVVDGTVSLTDAVRQYLGPLRQWALKTGAKLGGGIAEMALTLIAAFFFYRNGSRMLERSRAVIDRVLGDRGYHLARVAEETIRSVVYGMIGTALVQGALAGVGFWIAGVPVAVLLGLLVCFFSLIPMGAVLVWAPAALWLLWTGEIQWALFLLVWNSLVVGSADNILRPLFISRGSERPLLLVVLGVLGGAMAFGMIGIFLGPTLLMLGYTLLLEWTFPQTPLPEQDRSASMSRTPMK